jgi:phosphatidylinositol-3-phosphatase
MTTTGGRAERRRRRKRRQRRKLAMIIGGTVLAMGLVVGAAFALPPSVHFSPEPSPTLSRAPSASPTPAPSLAATASPTEGQIDKVIVFVLENHSAAQIKAGAPQLSALAEKYGDAPQALAPCGHPSQPNYVCLSTGGKYLSSNDVKTLPQPDVWNNTVKAGRTMKVYADHLPAAVGNRRKDVGSYAPRHVFTVPFVATKEKADNFVRYTVDTKALTTGDDDIANGTLPNVGAIIPDNCHNAHDRCKAEGPTQLGQADRWIGSQIQLLQGGPDWKSGRLLIIVTADEDNKNGVNDIPMIVVHPSLKHFITEVPVDLYSVGGLLADVGHTPRLGKQRTAPDFAKAFGLPVATG